MCGRISLQQVMYITHKNETDILENVHNITEKERLDNRMKKKLVSLLLCGAMVGSFMTGCGGNSKSDGKTDGSEQAKVDIFQNKSEFAGELEEAAKQYMSEHPNVTINVETVQGNDYNTSLKAKMLNDDKPEIFCTGFSGLVEDYKDYVEDLSDQPWVSHIRPEFKGDVTLDDKVYGLPLSVEGYGLVYNKEIFEAAGIDGAKLTTYDAIDEAFAALQKKIDNGDLKDQYPALEAVEEYAAKESFIPGLHMINIPLQAELKNNQGAYEAKELQFTYADALKALVDLETKYTPARDNLSLLNSVDYSTEIGGGIGIERVAVVQQGNWIGPEVKNVAPEVAEKLDILPIPLKGVTEDSIATGISINWCVNAKSGDADKAATKDFLNWLFQSDDGKKIVVENLGCIPAFDNYDGIESTDTLSKVVQRYMEEGKTMPWVTGGFPSGYEPQAAADIQGYFAGDLSWEKCVEALKADWAELRK